MVARGCPVVRGSPFSDKIVKMYSQNQSWKLFGTHSLALCDSENFQGLSKLVSGSSRIHMVSQILGRLAGVEVYEFQY